MVSAGTRGARREKFKISFDDDDDWVRSGPESMINTFKFESYFEVIQQTL